MTSDSIDVSRSPGNHGLPCPSAICCFRSGPIELPKQTVHKYGVVSTDTAGRLGFTRPLVERRRIIAACCGERSFAGGGADAAGREPGSTELCARERSTHTHDACGRGRRGWWWGIYGACGWSSGYIW
eukprot:7136236-Prymnesium_polylepis.1